jgi:hypothetical protein
MNCVKGGITASQKRLEIASRDLYSSETSAITHTVTTSDNTDDGKSDWIS